ncbi:hypothetical protein C7974DRAFT_401123 [Boeremia exigua]|uniref:uncharacterized protein n=1 Tax=Boeremia exigua TaxID=749465 RepID=UPI001E8D15F3|nr:uncharacterized protein C7974DRAFT_401123 [Boeremia exigua]KAH6618911.1 hypothetical protein C7974DRAFT_401123 [Boeremia exigua]
MPYASHSPPFTTSSSADSSPSFPPQPPFHPPQPSPHPSPSQSSPRSCPRSQPSPSPPLPPPSATPSPSSSSKQELLTRHTPPAQPQQQSRHTTPLSPRSRAPGLQTKQTAQRGSRTRIPLRLHLNPLSHYHCYCLLRPQALRTAQARTQYRAPDSASGRWIWRCLETGVRTAHLESLSARGFDSVGGPDGV